MAKFCGAIGYNVTQEVRPGVYKAGIQEEPRMGDVLETSYRNTPQSDSNIDDISLSQRISIIASPFDISHIHNIVYVKHLGARWKVTNVAFTYPRLTLTLGGIYNGPETEN